MALTIPKNPLLFLVFSLGMISSGLGASDRSEELKKICEELELAQEQKHFIPAIKAADGYNGTALVDNSQPSVQERFYNLRASICESKAAYHASRAKEAKDPKVRREENDISKTYSYRAFERWKYYFEWLQELEKSNRLDKMLTAKDEQQQEYLPAKISKATRSLISSGKEATYKGTIDPENPPEDRVLSPLELTEAAEKIPAQWVTAELIQMWGQWIRPDLWNIKPEDAAVVTADTTIAERLTGFITALKKIIAINKLPPDILAGYSRLVSTFDKKSS